MKHSIKKYSKKPRVFFLVKVIIGVMMILLVLFYVLFNQPSNTMTVLPTKKPVSNMSATETSSLNKLIVATTFPTATIFPQTTTALPTTTVVETTTSVPPSITTTVAETTTSVPPSITTTVSETTTILPTTTVAETTTTLPTTTVSETTTTLPTTTVPTITTTLSPVNRKYPPISLYVNNTDVSGAEYGNGVYQVSSSSAASTIIAMFDGNTYSADVGDQASGAYGLGTLQYKSSTGVYDTSFMSSVTDVDGIQYNGIWFQIKMPVNIYLSFVYIYRYWKIKQPYSVVVLGSNNGINFYKLASVSALNYVTILSTATEEQVRTKVDVNATVAYNYFRVVVTRVGYEEQNTFYGVTNFSIAEMEFYGNS